MLISRAAQIYTSAYRYAIIPTPLNLIVFVLCAFWGIFEALVLLCSCRNCIVNLRLFDPIDVDYHTRVGRKIIMQIQKE